ncbi:MAG: ATP-binding cassette domain-containing protein [Granulosicoccus sp.]
MSLIRIQQASMAFGASQILDDVSLTIEENARIALVGRNGEGKSTLLKLLAGLHECDTGSVVRKGGIRTAYLQQAVPHKLEGSIYATVAGGLAGAGNLLARYHQTSTDLANGHPQTDKLSNQLANLQDQIDAVDGWSLAQQVEQTLSRMSLDPDIQVSELSGGLKRRVLLARALVNQPHVLLLDEPTNHLDIGAVAWLERYLKTLSCSLVFVTHDRAFLDAIAQHIVEIDRGQLTEWPGSYAVYRTRKQEQLEIEAEQHALFDKKLAQEETWIRQGIKARRTRNEGRVRALERLREQYKERRTRGGSVKMSANQAERSGKLVVEATGVDFSYDEKCIVSNLDLTMLRHDRLGIIGPNGCGKSTLINLLLGKLTPAKGDIKLGTQLEVAYYDQLRATLDTTLTAADNVSGGRDTVNVNGIDRHIMSYMQDFLFEPSRARAPITALSGGETGRLMLAKLFLAPSNLMVLDEPSNDLDVETLELLEALLADYSGTVILISHDRQLLENVVTRSLVYQGDGTFIDVAGGWSDFERERLASGKLKPVFDDYQNNKTPTKPSSKNYITSDPGTNVTANRSQNNRLSYALQRELDALPEQINDTESSIKKLHDLMSQTDFYQDVNKSQQVIDDADAMKARLEEKYSRWDELESLKNS